MLTDIHETTAAERAAPRIRLELPLGADLTVPGLEGRLVQVFQNIIANALSFSPPDGTVVVRAGATGDAVEVTVTDEGRACRKASWRRSSTASTPSGRR